MNKISAVKPEKSETSKQYQRTKLLYSVIGFIVGLGFLISIVSSGYTTKTEEFIRFYVQNDYLVLLIFITFLGIIEAVLLFPLNVISGFVIEHRYQLSNQRFSSWLWEQTKGILVSYPIMLIIIAIFFTLLRRYPQNWWFWMGSVMVLFSIIIARLAPVLLFPLFYKFVPLEDKSLATDVSALCKTVGLRLKGVYQFNLSKTTRKANAAFTGIGKSKRVILGDTLLSSMESDEILAVLAHELGHYKLKHIWKGMAIGIMITFLGLFLVATAYNSMLILFHFRYPAQIAALPLIGILLTIYQFVTAPLQNAYSRANERVADDFAVKLTGNSQSFISGLNKLAEQNLSDRTPHPLVEFLFYSHPSIDKRISRLQEKFT
ncbi:MAG: M48 family metallopeptidase [Candidatus Marinimicrobia bacterium]|nr:M48 family metallopeptidase [Candidatus Neomarinimicrobiota bacterium]